jgi:hypothetical protein
VAEAAGEEEAAPGDTEAETTEAPPVDAASETVE